SGLLNPEPTPMAVPMGKPVRRALPTIAALIVIQFFAFTWVYSDEYFLRDVASSNKPPTSADVVRIESIYEKTTAKGYPSTDRLVLLIGALAKVNRSGEMDEVTKLLAPRDRHNVDLRVALVHALANSKEYERAEAEYQRLLAEARNGTLNETRQRELM